MCGIAGYITKNRKDYPRREKLKKMTDMIRHRGPDAEGQWCDDKVAFGHRRLAIIDLDAKSNQPMQSIDGRFLITYNGEIYNYVELREDLIKKGARFQTHSDTEVIIEAYRYYGIDCLNLFNGMWAFALYDKEEQCVVFSRDRFGVKPLYIVDREDTFIFASEIKAILAGFPEESVFNETCAYRYLSNSVREDADEETFFKNVKNFPPAHYLIYDLRKSKKEIRPYWEVNESLFRKKWITGRDPINTFKELFENAIALRLRADVEVGACLSGGLDSSAIVGCASKLYGRQMQTFSSIYKDEECNEEFYIRKVNERWGSVVHYIMPDDEEQQFLEHVKKLIWHHDQPTGGASLYSQYMVMREIGNNVKVILNGQGADELFAGYIPYYAHHIADLMENGSLLARCQAVRLLVIIMQEWPDAIGAVPTDRIVRLVGLKNSFLFQNSERTKERKIKVEAPLFTKGFLTRIQDSYQKKEVLCSSRLNTRLCNDVLTKSIPAILHNEDGNSMAFSIESRMPFLDYRIVEFALALDGKYKIKNQWTKWIVRKACEEYLPPEVVKRKNKMGFPAPFARWLRTGKSKEKIREIVYQFGNRGIVPTETIDLYYRAHINHQADFNDILFRFFNMEIWFQMMFDRRISC